MELYKKHRPKTLRQVIGQAAAVKSLEKLLNDSKVPHAILLTGPSGVGKTTIARIIKEQLGCSDQDFFEKNCADFKGIDDVREIRRHIGFSPMGGRCRIWLIDECHKLTGDAQNAILKMLEDTPRNVYFILATTDPQKLIRTIHTRCSQIKLVSMTAEAVSDLLTTVADKEGMEVSADVITEIVEASEGSARKALVILEQVGTLETEKEMLAAIASTSSNKDDAINLARLLLNSGGWGEIAAQLKALKDQEAEGLRYMVLAYMTSVMLGGGKFAPRAYTVIDHFSRNFYDSKHAGLAAACWELTHQR